MLFLHTESRIPLKPVLGGMKDVAFSSMSHEQTQSNRVCCFLFCKFTEFPKDPLFRLFSYSFFSGKQSSLSYSLLNGK